MIFYCRLYRTERKHTFNIGKTCNQNRGAFIMIRTATLDRDQKPTKEQIRQIEEAAKREIVFDEDSPELTPAMEKAFRLAAKNRNTQRKTNIS